MRTKLVAILASAMACVPALAASPAYRPGVYDAQSTIFDAVSGFRTFNHQSLIGLLRSHGLEIVQVNVATVESLGPREGDKPGDVVYDFDITGHADAAMPCGLSGIHGTTAMPYPEEVIRRRGQFPRLVMDGPSPTGALLYWAATGKCLHN